MPNITDRPTATAIARYRELTPQLAQLPDGVLGFFEALVRADERSITAPREVRYDDDLVEALQEIYDTLREDNPMAPSTFVARVRQAAPIAAAALAAVDAQQAAGKIDAAREYAKGER